MLTKNTRDPLIKKRVFKYSTNSLYFSSYIRKLFASIMVLWIAALCSAALAEQSHQYYRKDLKTIQQQHLYQQKPYRVLGSSEILEADSKILNVFYNVSLTECIMECKNRYIQRLLKKYLSYL